MDDGMLAARQRLEQLRQEAHRAAQESQAFAQNLEAREHVGWSSRREVRVRVGSDGLIRDVEFTPSAPSLSPATLSRLTMEAHDRALLALRDAVDELAAHALPSSPELSTLMSASYHQSIPSRVEVLRDDLR
ncbi:YbaB/EbfC family nucleoid-associated protein [Microbacterium sp. Marseille-Q6965]|uniref:YbaB/EbfC family nucleoid-associated protein n=1 Tax=Microbacterium sp. Marseille-Q6965 TaxID=2965072 RepID=UPI0021B83D12|nr:YbaB/EbfC family nucleoid-associated protein [Microbacterium sp. Marseille-Q6965]